MNIKENNKLIAEFIGIKEIESFYDSYGQKVPIWYAEYLDYKTPAFKMPNKSIEHLLNESKFNSSWDWLMPVFKHMDKSHENGDNEDMRPYIYQDIDYFTLEIRKYEGSWDDGYEVIFQECGSRYTCDKSENVLDYAYYVVVEFIKWYNKNK
jgi:hypothetical protein